jgi:hypothetical protein
VQKSRRATGAPTEQSLNSCGDCYVGEHGLCRSDQFHNSQGDDFFLAVENGPVFDFVGPERNTETERVISDRVFASAVATESIFSFRIKFQINHSH